MKKITDQEWVQRFADAVSGAPTCGCGCGEKVIPLDSVLSRWKRNGGTKFKHRAFIRGHQLRNAPLTLSHDEYQVLIGSSLGDGCLFRKTPTCSPLFIENHGPKQEEYVKWKAVQLASLDPVVTYHKNGGYGDRHVRVCTKSNMALAPILEERYPEPSTKLINDLEPLGFAVWFMDDGTSGGNAVKLCTNGRTLSTLIKMQHMFKTKFGLRTSLQKHSFVNGHQQRQLNFLGESREAFCELIRPHIIPSMEYKLDWMKKG